MGKHWLFCYLKNFSTLPIAVPVFFSRSVKILPIRGIGEKLGMADSKKSSIQKKSGAYLLNIKHPERTAKRIKIGLQRIHVSIVNVRTEYQVHGAVGFVDISETGAGFFTAELLTKGTMVEVCFTEPSVLKVRALVAWSIPITTRVQSARFPCRAGLQFVYDNEEQKSDMKIFIEQLSADPVEVFKRKQLPTKDPSPGQGQNALESMILNQMTGAPGAPAVPAAPTDPTAAPAAAAPATPTDPVTAPAAAATPATEPAPETPVAKAEQSPAGDTPAAPVAEAPKPAGEGEGQGGGQSQAA